MCYTVGATTISITAFKKTTFNITIKNATQTMTPASSISMLSVFILSLYVLLLCWMPFCWVSLFWVSLSWELWHQIVWLFCYQTSTVWLLSSSVGNKISSVLRVCCKYPVLWFTSTCLIVTNRSFHMLWLHKKLKVQTWNRALIKNSHSWLYFVTNWALEKPNNCCLPAE